METTPQQDAVINGWFERWKPVCQVCGGKKWGVNSTMLGLASISSEDVREEIGKHMPVVVFVCENCSNTITISAVQAKVIPPQEVS